MPRKKGKFTAPSTPVPALRSEQSGEQVPTGGAPHGRIVDDTFGVPFGGGQGLIWGNGGSYLNPMGFPGYGNLYTGEYSTYRWMLCHPVVRLVRAISTSVIVANTWDYKETRDNVPDAWTNAVKQNFDILRLDMMKHLFLRGRDLGWAGVEPIWEYSAGKYWVSRLKGLLNEKTDVLVDGSGNPVGLRNTANSSTTATPYTDLAMPYKAWLYSHDSEAGYVYGRSWLENIRSTGWKMWLDCAQQLQKLGAKISGMVTIIRSPSGTFKTSDGRVSSYKKAAEQSIADLAKGAAGIWWPSLGLAVDSRGSLDAIKVLAELATKSLTNIEVVDFSGNSQAISPILDRMKHAEELIFNGGERSARTGLEGKHGTKEEAGVHTDSGTVNAEIEDQFFARACQPMVDSFLTLNFGDSAKGAVRIAPPSLVDRKTSILRALMLALLNNPEVAQEFARTMDVDNAMDTLGAPRLKNKEFDPAKVVATPADTQQKQRNQPEPQGGSPTGN